MFDVQVNLTGADEVMRRLRSITDEKRVKKIATAAARKGMNIVRDAARANARLIDDPWSAANIPKNIVTQNSARTGAKIGGVVMRVGVQGGANTRSPGVGLDGLPGKDTRHWRYIEFGSEHMPSQSFMRPALENNAQRVADTITREMAQELDKAGA